MFVSHSTVENTCHPKQDIGCSVILFTYLSIASSKLPLHAMFTWAEDNPCAIKLRIQFDV